MSSSSPRVRRSLPGIVALAAILILFLVGRLPSASGSEKEQIASRYKFTEMPTAMPPGYRPGQTAPQASPASYHIRSWISAVGASVALAGLWGRGRSDAMCLLDTRTD